MDRFSSLVTVPRWAVRCHTDALLPRQGNLVDRVGVYGKQTAAYGKSLSDSNVVRRNVFLNGPRAGVNCARGSPLPLRLLLAVLACGWLAGCACLCLRCVHLCFCSLLPPLLSFCVSVLVLCSCFSPSVTEYTLSLCLCLS